MLRKLVLVSALAVFITAAGTVAWGITIDGNFGDWSVEPIAYQDKVNEPAADSTFDYEHRGLGTTDYGLLGPYAESTPGPENELDVDYIQQTIAKGMSGTWADGILYFRAKLADGRVFDLSDPLAPGGKSAISATKYGDVYPPVAEQSYYDLFLDLDPGAGTGYDSDMTGVGYPHFSQLDGAEYLVEVTETYVGGLGVFQLYRYAGAGSDWTWTWVAEVSGAFDTAMNSFEVKVPLSAIGFQPECGKKIGYALFTSDSEDFWGDDLVPGNLGGVGITMGVTDPALTTPERYLEIVFEGQDLCRVNADPRTQGYWWRQAISLDLIPGFSGQIKKIHPDWTKAALSALFAATDPKLAFSGQTTAMALWANPANIMAEKSLKQYAALLLNTGSNYLTPSVEVDLSGFGLGTMPVGQVILLLKEKWLEGKFKLVNDVADAINTGAALR